MDAEQIGSELVRELLKLPVQLVAVSPGTLPEKGGIEYGKAFGSIDDAYSFFRRERSEGRWTLWLIVQQ